jgi:hypothetical protein
VDELQSNLRYSAAGWTNIRPTNSIPDFHRVGLLTDMVRVIEDWEK